MFSGQLIGVVVVLFMIAVNWLVLSKIDVWGPSSKTIERDIPVRDIEIESTWRGRVPQKTLPSTVKRYRRERDEIPLTQNEQMWQATGRGLVTITILYVLDFGILWALTRLGPVSGGVNGIVKQLGGNLSIAAAGILGAFLVLFIVSIFAFRMITKK